MNRSDSGIPSQLRVVGATDLERRLLDAGARELPSVELTRKMQQALGISIAAGVVTATHAAATAAAKSGLGAAASAGATATAPAFAWSAISVGVIALAVTGAVVGVRSTANHHAAGQPPAIVAPAPAIAPPLAAAVAPAAGVGPAEDIAPPVGLGRRMARASARRHAALAASHHAAIAATPSDLRAEIALVDAARTSVAGGADDRALALLHRYDASYPRGTFRPEAAALRIEALDHLGRGAQARALAQKFVAAHPDSPLVERVARLTDPAIR